MGTNCNNNEANSIHEKRDGVIIMSTQTDVWSDNLTIEELYIEQNHFATEYKQIDGVRIKQQLILQYIGYESWLTAIVFLC